MRAGASPESGVFGILLPLLTNLSIYMRAAHAGGVPPPRLPARAGHLSARSGCTHSADLCIHRHGVPFAFLAGDGYRVCVSNIYIRFLPSPFLARQAQGF